MEARNFKNNFFSEFVASFFLVFLIFFIAKPTIKIEGIETLQYGIGSMESLPCDSARHTCLKRVCEVTGYTFSYGQTTKVERTTSPQLERSLIFILFEKKKS